MRNAFPSGNNSRPKRTCFVENDEYIGEILGSNSTTPVIQTFPVNPGQSATFPWLSEQALQWEKYRFDYLEFYYKPEVSGFATEGQSGKVILVMDYDASDPAPTTKQEAEDTDPHVDGMPYEDVMLTLDPREMFKMSDAKYVRPFGLPGGADIKTYDVGNLSVMTTNNGGTAAVGELHVRYGVTFEVPVLEATKSAAPANNQVFEADDINLSLTTTVTKQATFATIRDNGLGVVNTAGSILLPAGNYLVTFGATFASTAAITQCSAVPSIGIVAVPQFVALGFSFGAAAIAENLSLSGTFFIQSTGANPITVALTCASAGTITVDDWIDVLAV
jgi:hypothetical protein